MNNFHYPSKKMLKIALKLMKYLPNFTLGSFQDFSKKKAAPGPALYGKKVRPISHKIKQNIPLWTI